MRFDKFNLSIAGLYILGFILILLNFLTEILNFVAIILFTVATAMLTYALYKRCKMKNAIQYSESEEIIMELSLQDGMESYVPKEKKSSKRKAFFEKFKIYSPCIISGLFSILLFLLVIMSIF
ncbi:MAG: hypothetical protein ACI4T1_00075 [Christensenellales bacterium]